MSAPPSNGSPTPTRDHPSEPDALAHFRSLALAFVNKYVKDDVSIHAMSLTYTTILSIVPLLAVAFSVLKAFGVHNQLEPLLEQTLAPLGPEGASLAERIVEFVHNLQVGVLGTVGLAGLFYTVISLVSSIEDALNRIWRARQSRPWGAKVRDYLSVVLVGPVLLVSALALTASAQQHELVQRVFALAPWLLWLGTVLLPYVMLCAAFTLLYRFVPNTTVRWSAAAVGGITCASAWKVAGSIFTAFVAGSARYAAIYSSFAILVIFLIWIYVSWLIVLIAAEVAYAWQHPADVLSRLRDVTIAARERNGLTLILTVARRHLAGAPPISAPELATASGLPSAMVEEIIDQMVEHSILLAAERPPGIALARPPEAITVAELLTILRGDFGEVPFRETPASISAALDHCRGAVESALHGLTLRSLATEDEAMTAYAGQPPQDASDDQNAADLTDGTA